MRMDMQKGVPPTRLLRPAPALAWLFAAPDPAPWYVKLFAFAVLGVFLFSLIRALGLVAARLWRRAMRAPAAPLALRWATPPARFQAEPHHWALASALVFSVRNGDAWDRFALDESVEEAGALLRSSWGIHDRDSLMEQLRGLFDGGHRAELQPLARRYTTMPQERFDQEYAQAQRLPDGEEKSDLLWRMRASRENRDGIRYVDFLAWDLVRIVWLCRHGVHLGFMDEIEARQRLLLVSQRLQQRYEDWEDCANQFLRARGFWAGGNPAMDASQDDIRATIQLLREDPHSPWKLVDWRMPLA